MKDIKGFEGLYAITKDGKVWAHRWRRYLKHGIDKCGYSYVNIQVKKKKTFMMIHRLVAEAYLPNPKNLPIVCHKVESMPANNHVNNLWWGTQEANIRDSIEKGRFPQGTKS